MSSIGPAPTATSPRVDVNTPENHGVLTSTERETLREKAIAVARTVTDPEMPMLTLEDLGVLREVEVDEAGQVVVAITPTYTGCPAMAAMRDDLVRSLQEAGLPGARVRVSLTPAWSSDWISERGRQALRDHGLSAPGRVPARSGPVALSLMPTRREIDCPRCGSAQTELTSEFGPTACKALYRCTSCFEPFEHVKEI
ncbi:phenylacetate-CoA oxygenase subunit PaaJ [Pedococcus aerophilus]|uniref:Phenylacetate-CoA oxygenase subunit PaaJ n=1 Tax=Pedococcus aerophilus TaxID=436356 RepID=A0ABP6H2T5_9MICO